MSTGSRRSFSRRGVAVLVLSLLFTLPSLAQTFSDPDAPKTGQNAQSIYRDDPAARAKWFMRGRMVKGENPALLLQRAFRQKLKLRQSALQQFQQQVQALSASGTSSTSTSSTQGASLLSLPAWQMLGPAPISGESYGDTSGRITAIAVDPCDTTGNTVYVGGAYGGVWRSTNAAASDPTTVTWTPLYDTDPAAATLTVGAISLAPSSCSGNRSQIVVVGTGEPNNAGDSYYGQGIMRSTDGGSTWSLISTADNSATSLRGIGFARFAWSSSSFVVAAGAVTPLGNEFDLVPLSGSASNFYWSNDAGASWHSASSVMDGATPTSINRIYDVVWNPSAAKFFGVMRWHGIYQSTDGQNWTRMASQPGTALTTTNCPASTSQSCAIYRGTLAVKPGANEMYAMWTSVSTLSGADQFGGVARTLNGSTWTTITSTGLTTCGDPGGGCAPSQGFYNQFMAAVPNSTNTDLYVGFINVWRCTLPSTGTTALCNATTNNAPNRFNNLTHVYGGPGFGGSCSSSYRTIHPDEHAVAVVPNNAQIMYFGNDGGVYRSLTAQTGLVKGTCTATDSNPFQDLNTASLGSLSQFISISQSPTDPTVILGGTQDNGSPGMSTGDGQTSGTDWFEANAGDGGFNEIDQTNPINWYTTNTDVSIQKCVGGTQAGPYNPQDSCIKTDFFNSLIGPTQVGGDHGAFYTPYILDPANQSNIIVGTCRVWYGGTTGANLTAISQDFEPAGATPCTGSETNLVRSLAAGGTPVAGVSPVIYAGTDGFSGSNGGRIWVTTNANAATPTWTDTTGTINPGGFPVSYVAIDRSDATGNTAYITIMGFTGNASGAGHVFKTTNAGASWTDIGATLGFDAPADSIAIDPNSNQTLYVGTDVGVFFTTNGGGSWQEYGTGLPNVAALALRVFNHGGVQKLRVGTHGRGVWQADLAPQNDFSMSTGTTVATVRPGGTASWAVTVSKSGSFAGSVTMSCNPNPPATGTTCGIVPDPANLSAVSSVPVTLSVPTTNGTTAVGDYAFNLHGTDGATLSHDLALTLRVNDFAIGSATAPQTIQQTGSGTYVVTITPSGNFSDPIALSCANFTSSGMSCQFSQNNFAPGTTPTQVTVTLNAAANAQVASGQTFNVVAIGDGTTHSVSLGYTTILVQDFTFTGNITSDTELAGNTANFSGTLTPLNSFSASNMTVGCTGLPAGAACQFSPAAPSISAATPLPLGIAVTTSPTGTPNGTFPITATVTDSVSGKTHSINLSLTVQNFTVAVSPARTVAVGAGTSYTVTVAGQNGFAGAVNLSCGTLPAGVTCDSFAPATVFAGNSSTLTVLTSSSVTTGAKSIPVNATVGTQARSANASLTVSSTTPSFNLTLSPTSRTIQVGTSTTYTINVKSTTTTSPGTLTLSCVPPLPTGVTCSFSPASLSPNTTGTNVTATVNTTVSTPPASATMTFQAQSGTTSMLKRINATLQPTDFDFGVSPANQVIPAPGGSAQYTVTMHALDGFNSSVALSCTGLPAGWSCGFNPASATPTAGGVTSTLTVTTTATPFGPTNITVQGAAGSLVHSQQVTVTNGSNDYLIALASGSALVAVRPGQTANWSIQLSRFGTFSATVAESCVYAPTTPSGVACNITPNPADLTTATCPSNGACQTPALAIPTTAGTTAVGDYTFNFHGNGGGSQHDLPLTLRVNDFSITSSSSPQTIQQANSATYQVTLTSLNSYGGTVTLSCANFTSSGMSCGFSQNNFVPAAAGTQVTVTVSAAGNAAVANNQTFNVVASDGTTSHSVSLGYSTTLVQDFTYTNSTTATQTVLPGQQANYSTTLTPLNSFSASVNLTCSGLPANTTCSFNPTSPVAIGSATPKPVTVTINTTNTTPAGNSTITVTATDPVSGKTHSVTNLSLAVQSFTLSVSPTSRTIPPGSGTTFSVTVNAQNGFAQPVTLSCPAAPAGLTCTPPAPINPGSSGIMTVFAASSITAGAKTLAISGTTGAGAPTVNQNVSVVVSTTAASFTITDSVPTKSVAVGGSATYSLSVRSTSSLSPGTVTMSCVPPLPAGVSCSFSPASFIPTTLARTVTATVHTTASTPAQSFALQFQGTTASQFKTSNFTLNVGDYSLGVTPPTQTIPSASGGSTQYTVTLTSIASFSTAVSLSCTGLPAGWTCGFSPTSVTPTGAGATSTLTLTTTNSPLGPTTFTVQGSGGGLTHTQQVQVINGQDFTLANGGPITVQQGSSNTVQINAAAIGTFSASVALSCPSLPAGFSCGFSPTSITPGTPSTLTISATSGVAGGQYSIAVQGQSSSPSLTHTTNVTVNVPDFSVGLTGNSNIVIRGGSLQLNGTATSLGGFATSTTFNCSTGDANAPCVASSPVTPTAGGAAVTVTVSPNVSATLGAHTVTLTGNDGAGHVHSATFGITVEDFAVAATNLDPFVEAGTTSPSYPGTVTGMGGFTGNIAMSCSANCTFTPNPVAASSGGTAYSFTITTDPAAAPGGPYQVFITGTGPGGVTRTTSVQINITATQDWSYTYQVATPQTQTVNAGQSATYNINLTPNNSFSSSVSLTCAVTGAPAGVGCGITGSPLTPPGTITLTVTTTNGTVAAGSYAIVVTGTGGGKTRTTTAALNVKDFTVSAGPTPQTVAPGGTADYTVGIATTSGFASSPTLSCQVLTAPAGAGCSLDSTSVAPGGSTLMHVTSTSGTTPSGSYTVQVTATSGSTVHTANVTYTVQSPNDFTITTSTPTKTTTIGTAAGYSVTVTANGSFASSVTLSCSNLPAGTSCVVPLPFVPSTTGSAKSVVLRSTTGTTVPGTYNFTITGTGGGLSHSIVVQIIFN